MNDVLITPASRKVEFKDSSSNVDAKIETDGNGNLAITNAGGDLSIGATSSDIFIGDGSANVDIVFEQSGEIRAASGQTITLGASNSNVSVAAQDFTILSTDAGATGGPIIKLTRDSASPAASDRIGRIEFKGDSSTGVERTYAAIEGGISDPSNTAEDGFIQFIVSADGALNTSNKSTPLTLGDTYVVIDTGAISVDATATATISAVQLITIDSGTKILLNGGSTYGVGIFGHFIPEDNNIYDLGSSSRQFRNTYTGSVIFEGATANAHETTLAVTDPTADRTVTLPDATGTVLTTGNSDTPTTTTGYYDADHVLINDGGVLKKITPDNLNIPIQYGFKFKSYLNGGYHINGDPSNQYTSMGLAYRGVAKFTATSSLITLSDDTKVIGSLNINNAYTLPTSDGSANQVLQTNGSGTLSFATASGGTAADDITAGDAAVNLTTTSGNITIDAQGSNTDIIFKGTDGSSDITALTLDMSEAGKAIFNAGAEFSSTDAGNTAGPILTLDRNSASPADGDFLGDVQFKGRNDAGEEIIYGSMGVKIEDMTDGTEDSRLLYKVQKAGELKTVLDIKADQFKINNVSEVFFGDPVSSLKFEGATGDAYELTLAITDPTADRTVTIPDATGTILVSDSTTFADNRIITASSSTAVVAESLLLYGQSHISGSYPYTMSFNRSGSGNYDAIHFNNSGYSGGIAVAVGSVGYYTSSDYRVKENVTDMTDATTRLKQLKPKRFNFIADETNTLVDGFIAHEVSDIVPEAITGEKDAVDDDGNVKPQAIDQSKLVPLLVKTIQELEARITALESQ